MSEKELRDRVRHSLLGKRLSATRKSCGLRIFQFGALRKRSQQETYVGETALHIVFSPWRISQGGRIVTGSDDYAVDVEGSPIYIDESMSFEATIDPNQTLQVHRMRELLPVDLSKPLTAPHTGFVQFPVIHPDVNVFAEDVVISENGDLEILLTAQIVITVFREGTVGEHWRILFPQDRRRAHLSMEGDGLLVLE